MAREDFLVKRILDRDFSTLKDDIDSVVAAKVVDKVLEKKQEVIKKLNDMKFFKQETEEEETESQ